MRFERFPVLVFLSMACNVWIFSSFRLVESLLSSHYRTSTAKKTAKAGTIRNLSSDGHSPARRKEDEFRILYEPFDNRRQFLMKKMSLFTAAVAGGFSLTDPGNAVDSTTTAVGGVKVSKRAGGLAQKIRGGVCFKMDELQRDLMQERWDLLTPYPAQLRSYVQLFTTYTDAAFPSDLPSDYGLRVALRYEVGRFFASVERLKRAIAKQALDEAYTAYADMSLHLDRYLRVGGLYTYYDSVIDNEQFFEEYNDALVYSDPVKDPAEVRDLVVLCKGPDKGKTGIVIGLYPDTTNNCVVKLDKYRGMREIRVVPRSWAAKRLGEQEPDDVFLIPRTNHKNNGGNKA